MKDEIAFLTELEKKVLWLSSWMIHHANHIRASDDSLKVGGHQASCASLSTIMTALYFSILKPQDRVAVKPHASPVFHAIQYLLGSQTREKLENFRGFAGAQSYPSRTKDIDDVDFSTGSVGLGVAQTLFAALVQDYLTAKDLLPQTGQGRMVALLGDAEMDEGNIFEALLEGWKHGLRNTWWIVDYNRQSLDAVVREGLWQRFEAIFRNFGWDVVVLKHGSLQQSAFAEPGGHALKEWIEQCPNQLYSALTFQKGPAWRKRLLDDIGDQGEVSALIERRSDQELETLMANLAGHDLPVLLEAFQAAASHSRPVCFIAYTIKGYGLPLAGHKDNHAGLMTPTQVAALRTKLGVREGHEWDLFEGLAKGVDFEAFLRRVPFRQKGHRRLSAPRIEVPERIDVQIAPSMSTQQGFGLLMHEIAKQVSPFAARVVTTSPDVTVSTNLGAWVNRRGVFGRDELADVFRKEKIPSTFTWDASPRGQHLELGIAEMNLFLMLAGLGLSHSLFGERLLPVGTLYDPFIERGLDALNYACYQDARFIVAATPSGVTLAPEGGAHQSIATPLIGMAQDGLASFEPGFVDELAVILRFAFDYIQRDEDHKSAGPADWLRDASGGSVYLRLSTRSIDQLNRKIDDDLAADIVRGGYWLRRPGPNAELVIAYTGVLGPEALEAVGMMAEDRRDVGVLAVTSADRLNAGWTAAQSAREQGSADAKSHVEELLSVVPSNCALITVLDGHPATLAWMGAVYGHRTRSLGVEHFGQTGTVTDLYRHYRIDAQGIMNAARILAPGRPLRHLRSYA